MKKMKLYSRVLGPIRTNCYFLVNTETKRLLIVDPADSLPLIYQKINEIGAKPEGILLTHGHFDHMYVANEVRRHYGIEIYACAAEKELLEDPAKNLSGWQGAEISLSADHYLEDLECFEVAGLSIQLLHTPGHTAGSCCYYFAEENVLISGDTLFRGSCGRCDLPTGSSSALRKSLQRLLSSLPDETGVYSGHGSETTIGYEKRYNSFV